MRGKNKNVCQNCRSRKLACDGKQPACSQCIFYRIPCSGYDQELTFIHTIPLAIQSRAKPDIESRGKWADEKTTFNAYTHESSQVEIHSQLGSSIYMAAQPGDSRHELEQDIDMILRHFSPAKSEAPAEFDINHNQVCGAWVEVLPLVTKTATEKPFLTSAIKTMAAALQHDGLATEESRSRMLALYGGSLREMSKALDQAHGVFRWEHCVAIMCLSVTNVVIPDLRFDWMTHAKGVGDLIERLGPTAFSTGILHTLFAGFRPLLLIAAIHNRRKTFLALPRWITIPFNERPISVMQLLLNKATQLPALLERYVELGETSGVSNIFETQHLRTDFLSMIRSLEEWETLAKAQAQSPLFWSKPDYEYTEASYGNALWFANLLVASSLTLCWALQIIARTYLNELDEATVATKDYAYRANPQYSSSHTSHNIVFSLAEMICDSMPYFMQPELKVHGPGSTFFTFSTAMKVFKNNETHCISRLSRCQQILARLASIGIHFPPP